MASDAAWAIAGGVASAVALLFQERMRYRHETKSRRDERRESRRHEQVAARHEAYARYLVAQQAIAPLLKGIKRSNLATLEAARTEHFDSRVEPEWVESGASEMHATLRAGPVVRDAIKQFEEFITGIIDEAVDPNVPTDRSYEKWSDDWERERQRLITAMARELDTDLETSRARRYAWRDGRGRTSAQIDT